MTKWSADDWGRVCAWIPCTHKLSTPCRLICVESGEYIKLLIQFLSLLGFHISLGSPGLPPGLGVFSQLARDIGRVYLSTSMVLLFSASVEITASTSKVVGFLYSFPSKFITFSWQNLSSMYTCLSLIEDLFLWAYWDCSRDDCHLCICFLF